MACFRPLQAWQPTDGGSVVFGPERKEHRSIQLPCGRCIGCRLAKSRAWAIRCMHEAQMHETNSFITLTYEGKQFDPSLNYDDFQKFMYRVRRRLGPTRFFACGEYGEQTYRPHFHALLFGRSFSDSVKFSSELRRSPILEQLWPHGFSTIGEVTHQSAAYVARYTCKKITGDIADAYYRRVDLRTGAIVRVATEFGHMSTNPGLGHSWFEKYWKDVYLTRDGVVLQGGKTMPAPSYYDTLLEKLDCDLMDYKQYERYARSAKFVEDCSPQRLAVREHCAQARERMRKRVL